MIVPLLRNRRLQSSGQFMHSYLRTYVQTSTSAASKGSHPM
jgi:hypothetical protein